MPLASLAPDGEKPGPPGVMPMPGDHGVPYAGVAPSAHGVIPGVIPAEGDAADPKNIPVAPRNPAPPPAPPAAFIGISIPYLHCSASRSKSKEAVPIRGSWPMMMFSEMPFMGSTSA